MADTLDVPFYPGGVRKLRPFRMEDIPDTPFAGPPGTDDVRLDCACGRSYPPPWTTKLPFEFAPKLAPDKTVLVPKALHVSCPSCGTMNRLPLPHAKMQQAVAEVYGDEAVLAIPGRPEHALVYAFVAIHPSRIEAVSEKMAAIKDRVRRGAEPLGRPFHVSELRSTKDRKKLGIDTPVREIDAAILDLMATLAEREDERIISATLFPPFEIDKVVTSGDPEEVQALKDKIRDKTLAAGITVMTELLTRQDWGMNITLEAVKLSHESGHIDYYAERVGRGLRFDLNFIYSYRGLHVGLPVTAPKSHTTELEVADLVAYVVRRQMHRAMLGLDTEFPIEKLGRVYWGMFNADRFGTHTAVGPPWHHFFPPERD